MGDQTSLTCPRCQGTLAPGALGSSSVMVSSCAECQGLWLDEATLARIRAAPQEFARLLAPSDPPPEAWDRIRYLPCPTCAELMNRRNFGGRSGIIVDCCQAHGTWFDRDELRRVVEHIREVGPEPARARAEAALSARRPQLGLLSEDRSSPDDQGSDFVTWAGFEVLAEVLGVVISALWE